jgi:uracil phosphoribosyltransferase
MHLFLFFHSLLTASSALPLEPRQEQSLAPELLTTINDLNTAVPELTTAVNNFDGSLFGLLPQSLDVVRTEAKLDLTILKATHITEKSASFTAEESTNIVNILAGGIGPIQASLDALKAKVPNARITPRSDWLTDVVRYIRENIHSSYRVTGPQDLEEAHRRSHRCID